MFYFLVNQGMEGREAEYISLITESICKANAIDPSQIRVSRDFSVYFERQGN